MADNFVRPQWWMIAMFACAVVFIIGLFVPNALGYPLVILSVIAVAVLIYLDYKAKRDFGINR